MARVTPPPTATATTTRLQTKVEKQFANGLNFLATYTYSKTMTDAGDLLNGGSTQGFRAPDVPGAGIHCDYGLASFDIRNVFHFSGGYELPFGKGKRYMAASSGVRTTLWSEGGASTGARPCRVASPSRCLVLRARLMARVATTCVSRVKSPKLGLHTDSNGELSWIGNPAAFTQPCKLVAGGVPDPTSIAGCVPLTGLDVLGGPPTQIPGPRFHRLDFSLFKDFQLSERFKLQFRSEFFNILNHPNFNAPGFGGNGVVAIGGCEQLHQFALWRNWLDSRCPLRSETDPVRSEAVLLGYELTSPGKALTSACRGISFKTQPSRLPSAVVTYEDRDHETPVDLVCCSGSSGMRAHGGSRKSGQPTSRPQIPVRCSSIRIWPLR